MYNRYIPQRDGSYQRRRVNEPHIQPPIPSPAPIAIESPPCPEPPPPCDSCPNRNRPKQEPPKEQGPFSFFRNLLPPGLDSEDLLILVLLLLMSGDCREDRNLPLLTLALYLFL